MSNGLIRTAGLVIASLALAACSAYDPMGVTHAGATESSTTTTDRASTGSQSGATGATMGSGGGSVAGQSAPPGPSEKEDQRGNTRPGVDRDGHGPAAGAIVDPAGVTQKR